MYKYNHFIPENTAPKGTAKIAVYNAGDKRMMGIPLGGLKPATGEKRYSFGLISDTHVCPEAGVGAIVSARLDHALTWFEQQGAVFVAHCGDIVNFGFENPEGTYNPIQYEEYKRIRDLHPNLPVYAVSGNHDQPVPTYIDKYRECTGHDIRFTVEHDNDVFIFMGQPKVTTLYEDGSTLPVPELAWLENQLANNADKRCFVFFHPYIVGDSGDTLGANPNDLLPESGYVTNLIENALKNHGRAVLFHGHAHFMPSMQELDELTNYTHKNGFPSVHVPSLAWAAYVDDTGAMVKDTGEGYGYLVDVYDDCIVLNGWDFTRGIPAPHGTLRVDVPMGEIQTGFPHGYTILDYIQFNKDMRFDTGIVPTQSTTLEITFTREDDADAYLYGVRNSGNTASVTAYLATSGAWRFGNKYRNHTLALNTVHTAKVQKSGITMDGSKYSWTVSDFTANATLLVGTSRGTSGGLAAAQFIGKIYSLKLYDGSELILDWIPCINPDGITGFYDVVGDKFVPPV